MRYLMLVCVAALGLTIAGCSSEAQLDVNTVNDAVKDLQTQAQLLDDLLQTIQANQDGLEYPFINTPEAKRADSRMEIMRDMSPERREEIRSNYVLQFEKLVSHKEVLTSYETELREIERDLRMLLSELEDEEANNTLSPSFPNMLERLQSVSTALEVQKTEILATQDEVVEFLGTDEMLKIGITYIIVNSPTM